MSLIDLAFAGVFIGVMLYYSPLLTLVVLAALPAYVALMLAAMPVFRRRLNERFARGAGGCKSDVNERRPSLELVMSVTVKEIGSADGDTGCCGFDRRKGRVIVHSAVCKENLLPTAAAHVQRRKIVEGAGRAKAREQPAILLVPEAMWLQSLFLLRLAGSRCLLGNTRGGRLLFRSVLCASGWRSREDNKKQRAEEPDSLQVRHFDAAVLHSRIAHYRSWDGDSLAKNVALPCCRIRNGIRPSVVIPCWWRYLEI